MRATLLGVIGLVCVATTAHAQLAGNPTFTVPGVVPAFTQLATTIACTNTGTTPATITVEIYDDNGAMLGTSTSPSLALQESFRWATRNAIALLVDHNFNIMLALANSNGMAKIFSTSKFAMCSAIVIDVSSNPPTSMASLPVVAGKKQK